MRCVFLSPLRQIPDSHRSTIRTRLFFCAGVERSGTACDRPRSRNKPVVRSLGWHRITLESAVWSPLQSRGESLPRARRDGAQFLGRRLFRHNNRAASSSGCDQSWPPLLSRSTTLVRSPRSAFASCNSPSRQMEAHTAMVVISVSSPVNVCAASLLCELSKAEKWRQPAKDGARGVAVRFHPPRVIVDL